jgi:hypothetical protein
LPPSTAKRVLLYRFDRQPQEGVVSPGSYLLAGHIELITRDGNLQSVAYGEFKALCFASEGAEANLFTRDNLFERRPKTPGLWARFTFCDGDVLDGILPHNLLDWPVPGYLIAPPKAGAGRQRVFIPRAALSSTEMKGVIGGLPGASKRRPGQPADEGLSQLTMFD